MRTEITEEFNLKKDQAYSPCPLCANEKSVIIGKPKINLQSHKLINKNYDIVQCVNCKLYYVTPPIDFSLEHWELLYNQEYFVSQPDRLIRKRQKELKRRFNLIQKFISNKESPKFLDIGSGEGYALIEAKRRGWEVYGTDIKDNRIDAARTDTIEFIINPFFSIEFPEDYFDIIYVDSVLEHLLNPL